MKDQEYDFFYEDKGDTGVIQGIQHPPGLIEVQDMKSIPSLALESQHLHFRELQLWELVPVTSRRGQRGRRGW